QGSTLISFPCVSFFGTILVFLSKPVPPSLLGEYDNLSLSAWPSPMVPLGQTVTLQCHFRSPLKRFRLFKTDGTSLPELQGHHFNTFTLGPVTREHAGSYTCSGLSRSLPVFSRSSDPLQIVVTGVFTKPSISAHISPLMSAGENVTLCCHSQLLDKFILHQENSTGHFQRHGEMLTHGHAPADFVIGPMTLASAGTYRCYGSLRHSPYKWSAPSDPVDIVITGLYKKPSLSAQGGPVVRSEENVTLVCSSESAFDQFHLLREGQNLGCPLAGGWSPHGALQAEFRLGPGTPAHSGVYRCYGSFTHSPYSWSDSSDPLFLSVTGEEPLPGPCFLVAVPTFIPGAERMSLAYSCLSPPDISIPHPSTITSPGWRVYSTHSRGGARRSPLIPSVVL
uniref:Ig-like domain-containing protein n=1 Tax=Bos indicus x Bos taurus TaxID=30522 RepID=A0A4W2I7E7_BOBOX